MPLGQAEVVGTKGLILIARMHPCILAAKPALRVWHGGIIV